MELEVREESDVVAPERVGLASETSIVRKAIAERAVVQPPTKNTKQETAI